MTEEMQNYDNNNDVDVDDDNDDNNDDDYDTWKVLAGSLATSLLDPRVCLVGASGGVYRSLSDIFHHNYHQTIWLKFEEKNMMIM